MPSILYEIAELPNGDIVLRKVNDNAEPLVRLHFSAESQMFLGGEKFEIAKAMIEAGMEAATEIAGLATDEDFLEETTSFDKHLLH